MISFYEIKRKSETIKHNSLFYSGHSMDGTFKKHDQIQVEKTRINKIRIGDITIFKNLLETGKEVYYVHRVVTFMEKNIITRGDNNPKNDKDPVTEKNLIGKATHYERKRKIHKVWNGRLGMLRARVLHGRLHFIKALKFFLKRPYRILKKTGIVTKLWRPEIETIHFETQDGPLVKYVHKGRTVASCWTDTNRWWFRRPYDFIIDPKAKAKGKR